MADLRCPMCGEQNPDSNENCEHCGARLKPLVIKQTDSLDNLWGSPSVFTEPPKISKEEESADWLQVLRAENPEMDDEPPAAPPEDEVTGWLSRLREKEKESAPPAAPIPTDFAPPVEPPPAPSAPASDDTEAALDNWLAQLRSEGPAKPPTPPPADASPEAELDDWLENFRQYKPEAHTDDLAEPPEWLQNVGASPAQTDSDKPDWVISADQPAAPVTNKPKTGPFAQRPSKPATGGLMGTDDWLKSLEASEPPPSKKPAGTPAFTEGVAPSPDALPEWMRGMNGLSDSQADTPAFMPDADTDKYLSQIDSTPVAEQGDLPAWLNALRPSGMDELPPSIGAPGEIPDWLRPASERPADDAPPPKVKSSRELAPGKSMLRGDQPDIAKAMLPNWLEALRPVDVESPTSIDDEREERAGPLAGMKGVLPAELAVGVQSKPGAAVTRFAISDTLARQAEIFRAVASEEIEGRELRPRRRVKLQLAIDRVVIALLLFAVVLVVALLPPLMPADIFPLPTQLPLGGQALRHTIDSADPAKPLLVVFEYEPATSGELNPAIEAVLIHAFGRGMRVAALSSYPAGAGIAQQVLVRAAQQSGLAVEAYGVRYINLGYLPGGAAGLQRFVANPSGAVLVDFRDHFNPWAREALSNTTTLNDFSAMVVAAASADSAQRWIEQTANSNRPPLAVVSSAAAEPLLYPYFSGGNPQLAGLLTGLSGGVAYNAANGNAASSLWPPYSAGIYTGGLMLMFGSIISVVLMLTRRKDVGAADSLLPSDSPKGELKRKPGKAKAKKK